MEDSKNPESKSDSARDQADPERSPKIVNYTLRDDLVRSWMRAMDREAAPSLTRGRRIWGSGDLRRDRGTSGSGVVHEDESLRRGNEAEEDEE